MFGIAYSQVQTIPGGDILDITGQIPGEEFETEAEAREFIERWISWKINHVEHLGIEVSMKQFNIIEWSAMGIIFTEQLLVVEL